MISIVIAEYLQHGLQFKDGEMISFHNCWLPHLPVFPPWPLKHSVGVPHSSLWPFTNPFSLPNSHWSIETHHLDDGCSSLMLHLEKFKTTLKIHGMSKKASKMCEITHCYVQHTFRQMTPMGEWFRVQNKETPLSFRVRNSHDHINAVPASMLKHVNHV